MTDHVARLYALALGLAVFFLSWAFVSARPWAHESTPAKDPRLVALERREQRLQAEAARVNRQVARRFARYQVELRKRQAQIAGVQRANAAPIPTAPAPSAAPAAPAVRVASVPPVTSSQSS